jgi:hypothetical protein
MPSRNVKDASNLSASIRPDNAEVRFWITNAVGYLRATIGVFTAARTGLPSRLS